jgi:tRNA (mo5U34)-methyltransferase
MDEILHKIQGFKRWYHRVEVAPGVFTPGVNNCHAVLDRLELPEDCTGLRALDIGARDGFFAFMLERRGAKEVIAVDHVPPHKTGFPILKDILGSKVEYRHDNVYNISVDKYGQFDIVLCLGLLYHLRNPLLALERIRDVCTDQLYVESHIIDENLVLPDGKEIALAKISEDLLQIPIMRFYPKNELRNAYSNWWGPNLVCLAKMLEATNFTVIGRKTAGRRAILKCQLSSDPTTRYWRTIESGLDRDDCDYGAAEARV